VFFSKNRQIIRQTHTFFFHGRGNETREHPSFSFFVRLSTSTVWATMRFFSHGFFFRLFCLGILASSLRVIPSCLLGVSGHAQAGGIHVLGLIFLLGLY